MQKTEDRLDYVIRLLRDSAMAGVVAEVLQQLEFLEIEILTEKREVESTLRSILERLSVLEHNTRQLCQDKPWAQKYGNVGRIRPLQSDSRQWKNTTES